MSAPPPPPRRARPDPGVPGGVPPAGPPRRPPTGDPRQQSGRVVAGPEPTRAQRQGQAPRTSSGRSNRGSGDRRWGLIIGLAVLAVIIIAAAVFFVTKKDSGPSAPTFKASTAVDLQPGAVAVDAVGNPVPLPDDAKNQILQTLGQYVDAGIVAPLRTGKAKDADLAKIFDTAAAAKLTGTDRAIVLDEGLPKAVGKITVTTPAVPLTALADTDGKIPLVTAGVQFAVKAQAEKGNVEITRVGTFVFAPDATGAWKITGWTLSTDRGGTAIPTTPTSSASATTTTTVK
jgi:hypothetical protein